MRAGARQVSGLGPSLPRGNGESQIPRLAVWALAFGVDLLGPVINGHVGQRVAAPLPPLVDRDCRASAGAEGEQPRSMGLCPSGSRTSGRSRCGSRTGRPPAPSACGSCVTCSAARRPTGRSSRPTRSCRQASACGSLSPTNTPMAVGARSTRSGTASPGQARRRKRRLAAPWRSACCRAGGRRRAVGLERFDPQVAEGDEAA